MPRPTTIRRIVLIGMMGSGKTTVGRLLAERSGWRYVDNDDAVRSLSGQEPEDVAAEHGVDYLHAIEAAALILALSDDEPMVLGAAAGVVEEPDCREALQRELFVVYLRARPETLRDRIGKGTGRRSDATDLAWLEERSAERDELYQSLATLSVDVDERAPDEVADLVLASVKAFGHDSNRSSDS